MLPGHHGAATPSGRLSIDQQNYVQCDTAFSTRNRREEEEEELKRAALERVNAGGMHKTAGCRQEAAVAMGLARVFNGFRDV